MKKSELKSYIKENIINTLEQEENKISPEDVKSQQSYNAELKKTVDLQKQLGEDEDVDDKDALDIAVKALKDITTSMKSLARKYSAADESDKEVIKNELKQKTSKKKELESLVAKLEKDAI